MRYLVILFVILNFLTTVSSNLFPVVQEKFRGERGWKRSVRILTYDLEWYAFLVGLDQKYYMFSTLHRGDYHHIFKAKFADGTTETLPLERQSDRTFLQKHFFDHAAGKFHLNLVGATWGKKSYSQFLCREFAGVYPKKLQAIEVEFYTQTYRSRREAWELGGHLIGDSPHLSKVETFSCQSAEENSDAKT